MAVWNDNSTTSQVGNYLIVNCTLPCRRSKDCKHCLAQAYCNQSLNKDLVDEVYKRNMDADANKANQIQS